MGGAEGLVVLYELENRSGVRGLLKSLQGVGMLEEPGDATHRVQVLLHLAPGDKEENHEADRLAVEGIESDASV